MYWMELICKGEEPEVVEEEVDDYYGEELPSDVEVNIDDLNNDVSFSSIRNYLKRKYGYCLARGIKPEVEVDDDIVYINDIVWGRKLSDSEYEAL